MVGKEVVQFHGRINDLQKGAGEMAPLKQNEDFEHRPHPKTAQERSMAYSENTNRAQLCPYWPRCSCIVQGYVNYEEKDFCGRKPKKPQVKLYRRSTVEQLLDP